jgi:hypothetical protein
VGQPGCGRLGDEEAGVPEPGCDLGRLVQQRPRIENLQHGRMRLAEDVATGGGQSGERP